MGVVLSSTALSISERVWDTKHAWEISSFLTKAEYHSSQSSQWPGPGCRNVPGKKERHKDCGWSWKGVQAASHPPLKKRSLFHDGIDWGCLKSLVPYILELTVPGPCGKINKSVRERPVWRRMLWSRAEAMEEHNLHQSFPVPPAKISVGRKSWVRLEEWESFSLLEQTADNLHQESWVQAPALALT